MQDSLQVQEPQQVLPRFLSVAEMVKHTGLSRSTITRYRKQGLIPAVKIGSRVLIDSSFLEGLKGRVEVKV